MREYLIGNHLKERLDLPQGMEMTQCVSSRITVDLYMGDAVYGMPTERSSVIRAVQVLCTNLPGASVKMFIPVKR
jgi:hypothetical protein